MRHFRFSLALLGALTATLGTAAARPWTLLDATAIPFMDNVQLSPDGRTALVETVSADLTRNSIAASYRAVTIANGATRAIGPGLSNPRFSPGSSEIAWLSEDEHPAVVITDARGAHLRTIGSAVRDITNFSWSPDGRSIAAIETASVVPGAGRRLQWLTMESDYRNTQHAARTLWVIDVKTGAQHIVTRGGWSYGGPETDHDPSWSPDGTHVALVRQPTATFGDFEHAQYVLVDIRSGAVSQIVVRPFFAYPGSAPPVIGPHGAVAYTHTWDGKLPSREDVFVNGRDVSAPLDRDLWTCGAGTIVWRSGLLLSSMMDGVAIRIYKLDPAGASAPVALTSTGGSVESYSIARDGSIAYLWSTPERAPELYLRARNGTTRLIMRAATLPAGLAVVPTRYYTWKDASGHTLHGQLTLPAGTSARSAPLIVEPHGGPQCADDASFSPMAQYMASNGYAYFRPDPPGSDGYGDWSYKALVGNWGPGPMAADLAGVDALDAAGIGDPSRTFIEGGSYGGYLTSWIVTHSDRFRAAVAQVPVTDLMTEYTLSEDSNIERRFFGSKPAIHPALLAAQSPITFVARERTPLLLMAGLLDTRAPYMQAIVFYKALAENGAPVRMLVDPKAGHGPDDPQGNIDWWSATMAWFAEHGGIAIPDAKLPR